MPTAIQTPQFLQVGKQIQIVPPDDRSWQAVAIYNPTPYQLTINWGSDTDVMQALNANVYKLAQPNAGIYITPNAIPQVPGNTFLGYVTAVWYLASETVPTNFPLPLSAFPNGALLLTQGTNPPPGFQSPSSITFHVAIPPGASLTYFDSFGGNGIKTITITGDQTGSVYFNGVEPTSGTITVTPVNDFSVSVNLNTHVSLPLTSYQIYVTPQSSGTPLSELLIAGICGLPLFSYDIDQLTSAYVIQVPAIPSGTPILVNAWLTNNAAAGTITGITDTFPSNYTWAKIEAETDPGGDCRVEQWQGTRLTSTPGTVESGTITITLSKVVWINACAIALLSAPLGTATIVDTSNVSSGTNATGTSPSLTPSNPNELAVFIVEASGFGGEYIAGSTIPAGFSFIPNSFDQPPVVVTSGLLIRQRAPGAALQPTVQFQGGAPNWAWCGTIFLNAAALK